MYQLVKDMSLREYAVSRAVREMEDEFEIFTQADIAEHIGCSLRTVQEAMSRLLDAGTIIRFGSARNGFRYELVKDNNARTERII